MGPIHDWIGPGQNVTIENYVLYMGPVEAYWAGAQVEFNAGGLGRRDAKDFF